MLPAGLRDRVLALEALAKTGAELYRQRKVAAVRGPWLQEPSRGVVVAKPSRNKARKLRARRRKELERAEREKGVVEGGGGASKRKSGRRTNNSQTGATCRVW